MGRLAIQLKVGDQPSAIGKEYFSMKEGFPICYICEDEWEMSLEDILPPNSIFCNIEINPAFKELIKEILLPIGINQTTHKISNISQFRRVKYFIPLLDIEELLGIGDLVQKLRNYGEKVPLLDGTQLTNAILKNSLLHPNTIEIPDRNMATSGTHDFGPGKTLTTLVSAWADAGSLTGNLTYQQTGSTVETSNGLHSGNLNGYTLKFTNTNPSLGDPTAGYSINWNTTILLMKPESEGSGKVIIEKFRIFHSQDSIGVNPCILPNAIVVPLDLHIREVLLDGRGNEGELFYSNDSSPVCYIYNNKVWDVDDAGIRTDSINTSSVIENNTVYACIGTGDGIDYENDAISARNNACYDNADDDHEGTGSLSSFLKCASSDLTGSEAGLRSRSAATDFESTSDLSSDFLVPKITGILDESGTTSILIPNTQGIEGNPRPNDNGTVSIGCHEVLITANILDRTTLRGAGRGILRGTM